MSCKDLQSIKKSLEEISLQLKKVKEDLARVSKTDIFDNNSCEALLRSKTAEIAGCLSKLEVNFRTVELIHRGELARVYVDGEYFGIYDFERKTFVD